MPLTFIHAADFHLGVDLKRFVSTNVKTALQDAQFKALEKTLTLAVRKRAAFVVICGDLFDSRYPSTETVERTVQIFDLFPETRILILSGTHDFLSEDSIFSHSRSRIFGGNVVVLNDNIQSPFFISDANCRIHFNINRSNKSASSPIAGLHRVDDDGFDIGLAHGSLRLGGLDVDYDFPIGGDEIQNSGLDFLALGHWHRPRREKFGPVTAAYSGIPQPLSFSDPEIGSVNCLEIDGSGGVSIEETTTSTISLGRLTGIIYHPLEVGKALKKAADKNTILKIDLEYSDNFKEHAAVDEIVKKFESRFLLIHSDDQHRQTDIDQPGEFRGDDSNPLIENFLTELDRLRQADSPERAGLYARAAELGLKVIKGE